MISYDIHMYVHVFIHIYICICLHLYVCIHIYIHTYLLFLCRGAGRQEVGVAAVFWFSFLSSSWASGWRFRGLRIGVCIFGPCWLPAASMFLSKKLLVHV